MKTKLFLLLLISLMAVNLSAQNTLPKAGSCEFGVNLFKASNFYKDEYTEVKHLNKNYLNGAQFRYHLTKRLAFRIGMDFDKSNFISSGDYGIGGYGDTSEVEALDLYLGSQIDLFRTNQISVYGLLDFYTTSIKASGHLTDYGCFGSSDIYYNENYRIPQLSGGLGITYKPIKRLSFSMETTLRSPLKYIYSLPPSAVHNFYPSNTKFLFDPVSRLQVNVHF